MTVKMQKLAWCLLVFILAGWDEKLNLIIQALYTVTWSNQSVLMPG